MKRVLFDAIVCGIAASLVGCSGATPSQRSQVGSANAEAKEAEFRYALGYTTFQLAEELIEVHQVSGSFAGCKGPTKNWLGKGRAGKVTGPATCKGLTYEQVVLFAKEQGKLKQVKLDLNDQASSYKDALGNVWRFLQEEGGNPQVVANFEARHEGGKIFVSRGEFSYGVQIDSGDGAICNQAEPFRIATADDGSIVIAWNKPTVETDLTGVELEVLPGGTPVDLPPIKALADRAQFVIDAAMLEGGSHAYQEPLRVFRGVSQCVLKSLEIEVELANGDDEPRPGDDPDEPADAPLFACPPNGKRVQGSEACWFEPELGVSCNTICGKANLVYHSDTDELAGALAADEVAADAMCLAVAQAFAPNLREINPAPLAGAPAGLGCAIGVGGAAFIDVYRIGGEVAVAPGELRDEKKAHGRYCGCDQPPQVK